MSILGAKKETFAVGVVDIFGLDEEGTAGLVRFLNTSKVEARSK